MKLAECTKTGKRVSMNRLLLAEDNEKNRVIYNFDDLSSIGVVAKVETEYDEEALEGDSGSDHIYYYHTKGAKDLETYFNEDRARLLVGRKILLRDRSPIYEFSGRIVKIEKCVYRNYSLYNNYDDEYLDIDFIYLNEFATEFTPKKEKKKEKKKDTNAILKPISVIIISLTIILGLLTTAWGSARLLSPIFFICSVVANSIVLIIEIGCFEQLDKSLEIK